MGRRARAKSTVSELPSGVLGFVALAVRGRAANYRAHAAHFREMAEAEPIGRLREKLVDLAAQYEQLAEEPSRQRDARKPLTRVPASPAAAAGGAFRKTGQQSPLAEVLCKIKAAR